MNKLVFAGGGSGGHFYPILAIIRKLQSESNRKELDIYYIAPTDFGFNDMKDIGVKTIQISTGKIRRYFSILNFLDIFVLFWGLIKSAYVSWWIMPDLVVSKGGYGTFPVLFWASFYRIPFIIHESDVVPGLVNKMFSWLALIFFGSFEKSKEYLPRPDRFTLSGNPVRDEIVLNNLSVVDARQKLGLEKINKKIILILGGSQGSDELNRLIFEIANRLTKKYYLIHQAGPSGKNEKLRDELQRYYGGKVLEDIRIVDFLDSLDLAYSYKVCDIVVSRAGAGSIFEIAKNGKPSILIPLMSAASQHQKENAYEYAKTGACLVIEQPNLNPGLFYNQLENITTNESLLIKMSQEALSFINFDSAQLISKSITKILNIK